MPNNTPLVSIIIPTYNRAHLIRETLDSLRAQTYKNWECIVVDDGSTDKTAHLLTEYIKRDSRIQYHNRPKERPKGANACRNYGFERSKGEYVIFLDSDDLLSIDCLKNRIAASKKYFKVDFLVFQSLLFINKKNDLNIIPNLLYKNIDDLNRFISYDYPWNISATLLKRSFLIKNTIAWDEELACHQDLDFYIFLLAIDSIYKKINSTPDIYIRMGSSDKLSKNKNFNSQIRGKYKFIKNIFKHLNSNNLFSPILIKRLYGLAVFYGLFFIQRKKFKYLFYVAFLFIKYGYFLYTLYYIFDTFFYYLHKKDILSKKFGIWGLTGIKKRFTYLPPINCTLGEISLKTYLDTF